MKYKTKGDLSYDRIRSEILTGHIPIGSKLTVAALVKQYGLSPMPVREALTKLTQEGLVRSTPHQGAHVAGFNYYEHLESSLIRSCLEKQLFNIALQFPDQIDLNRLTALCNAMQQQLDGGQLLDFSETRKEFFTTIYSVAPFQELRHLTENYYERYRLFHYFVIKIAEEDGLERTWGLLSEIKLLLQFLQQKNYNVCRVVFDQIQQNNFQVFAKYLMNSLEHYTPDDPTYSFLWDSSNLTEEKRVLIRRNIEMFIRIRSGDSAGSCL